ncbi:MAG TPA: HD domain-containing phosphohydrolase [Thermoanaerobaculia bacterium]|nr:HD domain-containing phosphohydrolase [Thermoanaerobaculia bacterium]
MPDSAHAPPIPESSSPSSAPRAVPAIADPTLRELVGKLANSNLCGEVAREREALGCLLELSTSWDEETAAHLHRLSIYVEMLALAAGVAPRRARLIAEATRFHDIGKLTVDKEILQKPSPLTVEERRIVELHTLVGARLLEGFQSPLARIARTIALCHHENWDGSGYPWGLAGEEIPFEARIVRLADSYDALRSRRAYKASFSHEVAWKILVSGDYRSQPSHFDPWLLSLFLAHEAELREVSEQIRDF